MNSTTELRVLTQAEVGKILRRSVAGVARLRRAGELAWLPGRPVLIPETEVQAYLDRNLLKRDMRQQEASWTPAKSKRVGKMLTALDQSPPHGSDGDAGKGAAQTAPLLSPAQLTMMRDAMQTLRNSPRNEGFEAALARQRAVLLAIMQST